MARGSIGILHAKHLTLVDNQCGRLNHAPPFLKDVHILTPGTWEYVALHGDFVGGIELRILGRGEYPGISRWSQRHHKGPYKMETGGSERERGGVRMEPGEAM